MLFGNNIKTVTILKLDLELEGHVRTLIIWPKLVAELLLSTIAAFYNVCKNWRFSFHSFVSKSFHGVRMYKRHHNRRRPKYTECCKKRVVFVSYRHMQKLSILCLICFWSSSLKPREILKL